VTLRFDVINLFDVSYAIRNRTGVGVFAPQYGPRRGYYFGLSQKFGPGANKLAATPPAYVPIIPANATWSWAGFYIGGNVGYSVSKFTTDTLYSDGFGNPLAAATSSTSHWGAVGGGGAGYNWQWGSWVAGIESDIEFLHQRTTTASSCAAAICNPAIIGMNAPAIVVHQHNLDWFGTLRARAGVAITPSVLGYLTGGLAFGEVDHVGMIYGFGVDNMGNALFNGNSFVSRNERAGWTAGAGIEARLAGNVTGKIEYIHVDLGHDQALGINPANTIPLSVSFNSRITEDLVRLGLNYKFEPYAYFAAGKSPVTAPSPERPRLVYKTPGGTLWTWTGFYFGANAGYANGGFDNSTLFNDPAAGTPMFGTQSTALRNGAIGGAQTGYNLQSGIWLAGLETDVQFSSQRDITHSICPATTCPAGVGYNTPVTLDQTNNLDWFGTVRGRLGVAVTPDMVAYGTGGLAVGGIAHSVAFGLGGITIGIDSNGNPTGSPLTFTGRNTKAGYAVGGGIETHLWGNLSGKIEYLHMSFSADSAITSSASTPSIAVALGSHVTDDIVRLGLNYKFDPNGASTPQTPVASKSMADKPRLFFKTPAATVWTWTGYYLGINGGLSQGRASTDAFFNDITIPASFATSAPYNLRGKVFGVQTGYNFQAGNWLWGIEGDLQLTSQHGNPVFTCPAGICNPAGEVVAAFDQNQKIEWFGTLRARVGLAVAPYAFAYVTGGAAVASLLTAGTVFGFPLPGAAFPTNPFSNLAINAGWTAGGGVEARLYGNWTGKIEYLYMDFGNMTTSINNQTAMSLTAMFNSHITDQVVRVGINYKFD
jgi:outer membrane immunogenic protein